MELTPQDTLRDLQSLLIDAIPGFEFPRKPIDDYTISTKIVREDEVGEDDFIIGVIWNHVLEETAVQVPEVLIECSEFNCEPLTSEEINILACLMKQGWVQRQVTSIENTRMKYSGSDFKFTSQANHLAKLLSLLEESRRDSFHMQRLYKRRKLENGQYQSNWGVLIENSAIK
jgi:hypothetical protein